MSNSTINRTIPIDVGDKPVQSTVLRDGVEVKAPVLSTGRVTEYLDKLPRVPRFSIPRVMEQGIPPGVKVARGTVVDITCVPATAIKVGLLESSHAALRERTVASVANVITDPLAAVLATNATSAQLSQDDRTKVQAALTQLQITTDEAQADRTFEIAYQTLRDVQVFR